MNFTIPHLQEKARDGCVNDSTVNDLRPERRHEGYWGKAKLHTYLMEWKLSTGLTEYL